MRGSAAAMDDDRHWKGRGKVNQDDDGVRFIVLVLVAGIFRVGSEGVGPTEAEDDDDDDDDVSRVFGDAKRKCFFFFIKSVVALLVVVVWWV